MIMCSKCKQRPAVVFISASNGVERKNQGLCLKCAKELGLPQVADYLKQMGLSESDFDMLLGDDAELDEAMRKMGFDRKDMDMNEEEIPEEFSEEPEEKEEEGLFERGGAGTVPSFLRNLFGTLDSSKDSPKSGGEESEGPPAWKK